MSTHLWPVPGQFNNYLGLTSIYVIIMTLKLLALVAATTSSFVPTGPTDRRCGGRVQISLGNDNEAGCQA